MKKIILLVLTALMVVGCFNKKNPDEGEEKENKKKSCKPSKSEQKKNTKKACNCGKCDECKKKSKMCADDDSEE